MKRKLSDFRLFSRHLPGASFSGRRWIDRGLVYGVVFWACAVAVPMLSAQSSNRANTTATAGRGTASIARPQNLVVPGTGQVLAEVGDDFEAADWSYDPKLPKVYNKEDTTLSKNVPIGGSANGRWYEGAKRGQPDSIRIVPTPAGGLVNSHQSLALKSLHTGGTRPSYQQQQDDFIGNVMERIGKLPVNRTPSVVTRVWLPPVEEWEQRTGCHFAFRIALESNQAGQSRFRLASSGDEAGVYWPGFFLNREMPSGTKPSASQDRFYFWMKATADSRRMDGPEVTQMGWWTLGMSVTPDGQVHYFAKPGVEDLTEADYIASSYPFGNRAARFRSFFFNVCNGDNHQTWSTEFVVDDPQVFVVQ